MSNQLAATMESIAGFSEKILRVSSKVSEFNTKLQKIGAPTQLGKVIAEASKVEKSVTALKNKVSALASSQDAGALKQARALATTGKAFSEVGVRVAKLSRASVSSLGQMAKGTRMLGLSLGIEGAAKIERFEESLKKMEARISKTITALQSASGTFTQVMKSLDSARKASKNVVSFYKNAKNLLHKATWRNIKASRTAIFVQKLLRVQTYQSAAALVVQKAALVGSAVQTRVLAAAQMAMAIKSKVVTAGIWLFNAALAANPIGLIVMGVAALVGGLVLLWKNWDSVSASLQNVFSAFSEKISPLLDAIKEKVVQFSAKLEGMVPDFIKDLFSDSETKVSVEGSGEKLSNKASGSGAARLAPKGKSALGPASEIEKTAKNQKEQKDQKINISFENMPKGIKVNSGEQADNVSLARGYAMGATL